MIKIITIHALAAITGTQLNWICWRGNGTCDFNNQAFRIRGYEQFYKKINESTARLIFTINWFHHLLNNLVGG